LTKLLLLHLHLLVVLLLSESLSPASFSEMLRCAFTVLELRPARVHPFSILSLAAVFPLAADVIYRQAPSDGDVINVASAKAILAVLDGAWG
jgi:hypothetical protein